MTFMWGQEASLGIDDMGVMSSLGDSVLFQTAPGETALAESENPVFLRLHPTLGASERLRQLLRQAARGCP